MSQLTSTTADPVAVPSF